MLWKPTGSLDCVDLGKEFNSVRFSLKEDMMHFLKMDRGSLRGLFYPLGLGNLFSNQIALVFRL